MSDLLWVTGSIKYVFVKSVCCRIYIPTWFHLFYFNLQIHTDSDEGEGNIKYTISGEGAGSIFIIDELTGDIHATERLDREEKAFYTLRAQARGRLANDPLEPESEFVIKVQDINDSEPKFQEGPYIGSVAELSPIGKTKSNNQTKSVSMAVVGWFLRSIYQYVYL